MKGADRRVHTAGHDLWSEADSTLQSDAKPFDRPLDVGFRLLQETFTASTASQASVPPDVACALTADVTMVTAPTNGATYTLFLQLSKSDYVRVDAIPGCALGR